MRIRGFGIDVVLVSDPAQIRWLNGHPDVVRPPANTGGPLHAFLHRRLLSDLRFETGILPALLPRQDQLRAERQAALEAKLTAAQPGRDEFVAGIGASLAARAGRGPEQDPPQDSEVAVHSWCLRLFHEKAASSRALLGAARQIGSWPTALPWRTMKGSRQKLADAKRRLAEAAEDDLQCVHATSIAFKNLEKSVEKMLGLLSELGPELTAEEAMLRALTPPPAVLRGCQRQVSAPFFDEPLGQQTLVVFLLGRAYRKSRDPKIAFMSGTWSQCPAHQVIPRFLMALWQAGKQAEKSPESGQYKRLVPVLSLVPKLGAALKRVGRAPEDAHGASAADGPPGRSAGSAEG